MTTKGDQFKSGPRRDPKERRPEDYIIPHALSEFRSFPPGFPSADWWTVLCAL